MKGRAGFTLIEVIVAVGIVAVGVLGAAFLQVSSLRHTGQAEIINQITRTAQGEVEWRRQTAIGSASVGTSKCESETATSIVDCEVTVRPCILPLASSEFTCSAGVEPAIAYELVVRVSGARDQEITLRSVNTGLYYVAGVEGELNNPWIIPGDGGREDGGIGAPIIQ